MARLDAPISCVASLLVLTALFVGAGGCATERINGWPLFFQEREAPADAAAGESTWTEVLYPFFGAEASEGRSYHAVRPLYNAESREGEGFFRLQYLWPLGLQYSRAGDTWQHRLFPLFNHVTRWRLLSGEKSTAGFVFPLFWWGRRPQSGPYFAVFPLAGVTKGVLGDRWSFLLFPLASVYRHKDYRRYDFLWPLITYGRAPEGKRRVFRAWPFYVYNYNEGRWRRHYVLWPFLRWGTENEGGKYVHRYFGLFPLYAQKVAYDEEGNAVAWQKQRVLLTTRRDTRPRKERWGWSALFTILRYDRATKRDELRIFPFFWKRTWYADGEKAPESSWTRYVAPWPLIWVDAGSREEGERERNFILAPFYWQYNRRYFEDGAPAGSSRHVTLWPLATYRRERDGARHFWILSHGWHDAPEGYKRNYRAFFDLFQYHSSALGERETRLLWRLYHHRRGPDGRYLSLGPLFTYDGEGKKTGLSVLFGLVAYEKEGQGGRWRLFYYPLGDL